MHRNPFRPVKFEDESEPLIFVSDEAELQSQPGNIFYTGKRGCGKTSTLKMADSVFREVSISEYDEFDDVLGVYINLNNKVFPDFLRMKSNRKNKEFLTTLEMRRQLTSEFLEKMLVRNFIATILKLAARRVVKLSLDDEEEIVAAYSYCYVEHGVGTLTALVSAIESDLCDYVAFARNLKPNVQSYKSRFEMKFHEFIHSIYEVLKRCTQYKLIRLLVDDCEVMPNSFQVALNTLVRTPQGTPTSWSISYVNGKYDARGTTINNQDLSREERRIRLLDELTASKYSEFCAKIADKRLRRDNPDHKQINIVGKLASFNINELIEDSMKGSLSKRVSQFKMRAENYSPNEKKYYEYFLKETGFSIDSFTDAAVRRKNVAAYLCLCEKYGLQVRYAGAGPILALSDGCIRDFLENMAFLFDRLTSEVSDPLNYISSLKAIPIWIQDAATREAAEHKVSSIKHFNEEQADLVEKFVEFIGHLVALVQRSNLSTDPLKSPERAIIGISRTALDKDKALFELVKVVELDGYAKSVEIKKSPKNYGFRLHRQFAARFGYSYRNDSALFFPITIYQLKEVLNPDSGSAQEWANKVYRHWLSSSGKDIEQAAFEGLDE